MDSLDNVFGNAEATAAAPVQAAETSSNKEKIATLRNAMKETIASDPQYTNKLRTLSNSLEVVNTLGTVHGKGNVINDKSAVGPDGKRVLKPVTTICGYTVKNVGSEAIPYTTEVFAEDPESGKWVGTVVQKSIAPGETIALTRKYMTMLCAIPEISFTLKNGKIILGSSSKKARVKSVDEELSSCYFKFNKDEESGTQIAVNDDEVKLSIDDADGKVKAEYCETFGFYNNPKERKERKSSGAGFTTQDLAANWINQLILQNGSVQ